MRATFYSGTTYATFADDVMMFGAQLACRMAELDGVKGGTMARWLARLSANV